MAEDHEEAGRAAQQPVRRFAFSPGWLAFVLVGIVIVLAVGIGLAFRGRGPLLALLASPTPTLTPAPTGTAAPGFTPTPAPTLPPPTRTITDPVTLTYWEQESVDGDAVLDALAAGFMQANAGVTIRRVHYGNEELRDLFVAAVTGGEQTPDLVRGPQDYTAPFVATGGMQPITDTLATGDLAAFFPGALSAVTMSNTLWAVPDNYGNHLMLLYNKKLVSGTVPADTDTWIAQMQTLTDVKQRRYGLVYNLDEPYWLVPWISAYGGWPLNGQELPSLNTAPVQAALQFVYDLKFVQQVTPAEADYDTAATIFKEGRAAYLIDGPWSLADYRAAGIDLGIAPLPRLSATGLDPQPMTGGLYWFVATGANGGAGQQEAARRFLLYMTGADAQATWLAKMGRLPSNQQTAASPAVQDDPALAGEVAQLAKGRGLPPAPAMACVWQAMRPPIETVMSGATPEPPVAEAAAEMQAGALKCLAGVPTPQP